MESNQGHALIWRHKPVYKAGVLPLNYTPKILAETVRIELKPALNRSTRFPNEAHHHQGSVSIIHPSVGRNRVRIELTKPTSYYKTRSTAVNLVQLRSLPSTPAKEHSLEVLGGRRQNRTETGY